MDFLLFYSNNCKFSQKFLKLLEQFPELDASFKKLDIETLNSLPNRLTEVPGIVINKNNLLQGQQAFDWLQEKVKDSFSAGPELDNKGGFQDNNFSFIDNSSIKEIPTNYSNLRNNKKMSRQDVKKKEFDSDMDRLMQERSSTNPGHERKRPKTPDFSLPMD